MSGRCTNETPFEPKSAMLAELLDQVNQHAERMTLLATAKPFVMRAASVGGVRDPKKPFVPMRVDTMSLLRRIRYTSFDGRLSNGWWFLVDAGANQVAARESRSARAEGSWRY